VNKARSLLAVSLLAAGSLAWAALPVTAARAGAKPTLIAAICCAVFGLARLTAAGSMARTTTDARGLPADRLYLSTPEQLWQQAIFALFAVPWPQLLIVAVLGLEALHPRRPWHTAVLGVVLLGYLVALQVAESGARLAVFGVQVPLIAAGDPAGLAGRPHARATRRQPGQPEHGAADRHDEDRLCPGPGSGHRQRRPGHHPRRQQAHRQQ